MESESEKELFNQFTMYVFSELMLVSRRSRIISFVGYR